MKREKLLKYLAFGTAVVIIIMMAAATVIEKMYGTTQAFSTVYHSPLFIALWAVAAISGVIYLIRRKAIRKPSVFLLHIALVLILAGALVTMLTGRQGRMHLRQGETTTEWASDEGFRQQLPFSLTLREFSIEYYEGSRAPSNYSSTVLLDDADAGFHATRTISMNNILKYRGYRFYQSSYDEDGQGSLLSVSHDPWGVSLTYTGYILLLISMTGFFFQKNSGFRTALGNLRKQVSVITVLLIAATGSAKAADADFDLPVLPDTVSARFDRLHIYYNDRIAPLRTMTRDFCLKAYGKNGYQGFTSTQVVTGWLFWYDWWNVVPFKLKSKERGTDAETEKESIRMLAASGKVFRIFPLRIDPNTGLALRQGGQVEWFSPNDSLPENLDYDTWVFIRRSIDLIHDEIRNEEWDEVSLIADKIAKYQHKVAGDILPSTGRFRAEMLYNRISRPMVPFMASITLGMIVFVITGITMGRDRKTPIWLRTSLLVLSIVLLAYLTLVLGLRWYISGHAPFAGSYSVMMLMAWLVSIAMTALHRSIPIIQPIGFILAGFTMLVASLASSNPQVTHLMPVLQSPLLSIHVLCMMVSYTLFGLVALIGIMGLLMPPKSSAMLRDISLVILYPAVFILTTGTFIGAVWANISWGNYWSWDPKETWALITMLIYAAMLHSSTLSRFSRPRFFHIYSIAAIIAVLITYFGVNLILGGMHAYA
ncbi:MAG: cytochrome c biogenesis protein CcsA [Bacteroidaceae bacterium]|nr:cytochrome c biogenesis protein CcsA [Bacteroidaceae bacterium]